MVIMSMFGAVSALPSIMAQPHPGPRPPPAPGCTVERGKDFPFVTKVSVASTRLVSVGGKAAAPGRLAAMSGSITIAPVRLTASKIANDNVP